MKKLLLSSIVLLIFSLSIFIFEVSCQKTSLGDTNNINSTGTLLYIKNFSGVPRTELWTCNIDGSNQIKVPIVVPSGYEMGNGRLSPDGNTIILELFHTSLNISKIGSCNRDGSNLHIIVEGDTTSNFDGLYLGSLN